MAVSLVLSLLLFLGCIAKEKSCATDSDCVPAQCCHATDCASKAFAPNCSGIFCTLECQPNTIDCGGGCRCEVGICKAYYAEE